MNSSGANYNVAMGFGAGQNISTGDENTSLGYEAGQGASTGLYNTLIGSQVAPNLTTGSSNTIVGRFSGAGITTGSGNTIIGYNGGLGNISNSIVIADGNGNNRIFVDSAGQVGIGTTSPSYTFHVVGTAGLSTGTAWTNASDIRLKDLHGNYSHGLAEIASLQPILYTYKKNNPLHLPSNQLTVGFVAQDVQKVIPEAVHKRPDGYLELNVDPIHWAVINAIKELKADNDNLRHEFEAYKAAHP